MRATPQMGVFQQLANEMNDTEPIEYFFWN
jgi:hypothetical protein